MRISGPNGSGKGGTVIVSSTDSRKCPIVQFLPTQNRRNQLLAPGWPANSGGLSQRRRETRQQDGTTGQFRGGRTQLQNPSPPHTDLRSGAWGSGHPAGRRRGGHIREPLPLLRRGRHPGQVPGQMGWREVWRPSSTGSSKGTAIPALRHLRTATSSAWLATASLAGSASPPAVATPCKPYTENPDRREREVESRQCRTRN